LKGFGLKNATGDGEADQHSVFQQAEEIQYAAMPLVLVEALG